MRRRISFTVLAATVAATLVALPASPAQASHSGTYHWARTANPFTVELDDNAGAVWDLHLLQASSDWSAAAKLNTVVLQGSFGSPASCSPAAGHVELCSSAYGNTGWLVLTTVSVTTGSHLTKASIKLNDTYLRSAPYNTAAWRQMLVCREIGRTLGLALQDNSTSNANLGSCMDATTDPDGPPSNEHPNAHDFAQLDIVYSHLDGFSTTSQPGEYTMTSIVSARG